MKERKRGKKYSNTKAHHIKETNNCWQSENLNWEKHPIGPNPAGQIRYKLTYNTSNTCKKHCIWVPHSCFQYTRGDIVFRTFNLSMMINKKVMKDKECS